MLAPNRESVWGSSLSRAAEPACYPPLPHYFLHTLPWQMMCLPLPQQSQLMYMPELPPMPFLMPGFSGILFSSIKVSFPFLCVSQVPRALHLSVSIRSAGSRFLLSVYPLLSLQSLLQTRHTPCLFTWCLRFSHHHSRKNLILVTPGWIQVILNVVSWAMLAWNKNITVVVHILDNTSQPPKTLKPPICK